MGTNERTVGDRGQVTIPKELRDRFDIEGGDEVVVHERDGRIVVEKPVTRADLAAGYRERAAENERLADELRGVSAEADGFLGEPPDTDG